MATHAQGNSKSKTVSAEPQLIDAAERRAQALNFRSFSAYIQSLLRKDLAERGDIVFSENYGAAALNEKPPNPKAFAPIRIPPSSGPTSYRKKPRK